MSEKVVVDEPRSGIFQQFDEVLGSGTWLDHGCLRAEVELISGKYIL